ncbi:hypothetical protein GGR28_003457 [Lewinella aquimaris]|uniref:Uncharacterized protein n=1 Tax=Neolewinella aquimaris TaxID=1835722 RepID=A0A840EFX4_9BACT|nr:hypothetical protein [Neolewinella aquimaris]MBB4080818.1 hypothetical protein [Neolewinella aquimaris]
MLLIIGGLTYGDGAEPSSRRTSLVPRSADDKLLGVQRLDLESVQIRAIRGEPPPVAQQPYLVPEAA